jgi:hypothetical protein
MVLGPRVIGCVPVNCACCAMRTEGSRAIDDGFGSMDTRFGAVDERRSGPGRAAVGCEDIVRVMNRLVGCSLVASRFVDASSRVGGLAQRRST